MKAALLALLMLVKKPLAELLSSKKTWTVIIGLTARGLAKHGVILPPDMANEIAIAFAGLLATFGVQDHGKAAAQIHADSMKDPPEPTPADKAAASDATAPP